MLALLLVSAVYAETAEKPNDGPVDQVARSLLNVTDYISNYFGNPDAGTTGVASFLPGAKKICEGIPAIKPGAARAGSNLYLIDGQMSDVELAPKTAFMLPIQFDSVSGDVSGVQKMMFDNINQKYKDGGLKAELEGNDIFHKAMDEAKSGKPGASILGQALMSKDITGDNSYVVFTGGTSADKTIVPEGQEYLQRIQESYVSVLDAIKANGNGNVHSFVMSPLGMGSQFNSDFVASIEVIVFYTGNLLTYWMAEMENNPVRNIYMVAQSPEEVFAMCKYCQYRTMLPLDSMGDRVCANARAQAGAASPVYLFSVALAALWWW